MAHGSSHHAAPPGPRIAASLRRQHHDPGHLFLLTLGMPTMEALVAADPCPPPMRPGGCAPLRSLCITQAQP